MKHLASAQIQAFPFFRVHSGQPILSRSFLEGSTRQAFNVGFPSDRSPRISTLGAVPLMRAFTTARPSASECPVGIEADGIPRHAGMRLAKKAAANLTGKTNRQPKWHLRSRHSE